MARTQIRGNTQIMDNTIDLGRLESDFLIGKTWSLSSDNSAKLTGLASPQNANDVAIKSYVDGLIDTVLKSPDSFATTAGADFPTDYKGTGVISEGDTFYVTDVTDGNLIGTTVVQVGELLVAKVDGASADADWLFMESNRDQATETVLGMAKIATQALTDAGSDDATIVTPLKLATYVTNSGLEKTAGDGLVENSGAFDIVAADASLEVGADDVKVRLVGASLEVVSGGIQLTEVVSGQREFNVGAGNTFKIVSDADKATLSEQPTGADVLAIATTKYVDDHTSTITASNGLTRTGDDIALGGTLTADTEIDLSDKTLYFSGSDGTVNIGKSGAAIKYANIYADQSVNIHADSGGVDLQASESIRLYSSSGAVNVTSDNEDITLTANTTITISGGNEVTLEAAADEALLGTQPTGAIAKAIATTGYVDDIAGTRVDNEKPTVTDGSADVELAQIPRNNTEHIYLNGVRQTPTDDYSISDKTVTFVSALSTGDKVLADYIY